MDALKTLNENFLSCSICTEIYKDPCTTGCGHTFCRVCLTNYTKTRRDAITAKSILCPVCRQMTKVPYPSEPVEKWTKQFKPHFLIQGLLDTFVSQKGIDEVEIKCCCFTCEQLGHWTTAVSRCHDCDVNLCHRCAKMHSALPGMSCHVISKLKKEDMAGKTQSVVCKEHNCFISFYCKDCKKSVCQKCCIVFHRKCHSIITIDSMMPEVKNVLLAYKETILTHLHDTELTILQTKSHIEESSKTKIELQSNIRKASQNAVDLIKQGEKQLMDELDGLTKTQSEQQRRHLNSAEADLSVCQQHVNLIDKALTSQSQTDVLDMFHECQSGLISVNMKTNIMTISELPKITFVEAPVKDVSLGRLVSSTCGSLSVYKPTFSHTIDIRTSLDEGKPFLTGLTVLVIDGMETIVVTDSKNQSVKSFWTQQDRLHVSSMKVECSPFGITKLSNNQVAITFWSQEFMIAQICPHVIFRSTVTTQKCYKHMTALNDTEVAASTHYDHDQPSDWDKPSIDIISLSGNVLKPDIHTSPEPSYLCLTDEGNILVTDALSGSVCSMTQTGDSVFKYRPTGDSVLCGPRGITTTISGDILVADYYTHKIIQLTKKGEFVGDILTLENNTGCPQDIFCTGDKLYVTYEDDKVNVFCLKAQH